MKKLILIFILLLINSSFSSQDATKIEAYVEISNDLKVVQRLNYTIYNNDENDASSVLLLLPYEPKKFDVVDFNLRILNYSSGISNGIFVVKVNDEMLSFSYKNYIVRIYDDSLVTNFGSSNIFTYNFLSYYNLDDFSLKLVLPDTYAITSSQGNPINPLPSKLYSSNEIIMLEWSQKLRYMDSKAFIVFFEKIGSKNSILLTIFLTFSLSFALGAIMVYLFLKKGRAKTLTKVLSKDEKAIVELLLKSKDLTQKDIGSILDMSKPKLSKLVQGLFKKEIIDIIPKGRQNLIMLKNEILQ